MASVAVKTASKAVVKHLVRKKLQLIGLKYKLMIAGILLAVFLLFVAIAGLIAVIGGGGEDDAPIGLGVGQATVSAEVAQYRQSIFEQLSLYGLESYTELMLALMMQESGGRGNDPMQSSESFCGSVGCITDPQVSIEKGVLHFKSVLERANHDVKLTLQSYNFGGGFIDYVQKNGGAYTKELAISFSQMMYQKLAHTGIYKCHRPEAIQHNACYGDYGYADAVLRYLPSATMGNSDLLQGDFHSPLSRSLVMTSPFGWRIHPIHKVQKFHKGIDLACTYSDVIHSVKDGTVVFAGTSSGYGNLIQIQHGNVITAYAHLNSIGVKNGQQVKAGQGIGYCGTTGGSTGTHLHFEVKTGMWDGQMDPAPFLGL